MKFKAVITDKPNFKLVPINIIDTMEEFNILIKECKDKNYNKLIRTKSGGISYKDLFNGNSYDVKIYGAASELTISDEHGYRRIQLRRQNDIVNEGGVSGEQAFRKLTNNYRLVKDIQEEQPELDKWYQKRLLGPYQDITIKRAYHLDLNSAFPYYLQLIQPSFEHIVRYHYERRKVNEESKAIMNYGIGSMRKRMKNTWKAIMNRVKQRLEDECKNIDGTILAFNTDGIWFTGTWNGQSSKELGQFKIDHKDVTIRFKSDATYEFIEDGVYYPVQPGVPLGTNKEWGDIYKQGVKAIKLNSEGYLEKVEVYGN